MITEEQAKKVWKILVKTCGAPDDERMMQQFISHATSTPNLEFRFQGNLGFGGKIYMDEPPYVTCYPEDENEQRKTMINIANKKLAALWKNNG